MRILRAVAGFALALCAYSVLLAGAARADEGRVIVKYRSESEIQSLGSDSARMRAMSAQTGLDVVASRLMSGRMHAVRAAGVTSQELAARLAARADVEYAVPDKRMFIAATTPTDTLYSSQWYLQATEVSAINAQAAWDTTTGSSSVVVAVVDTGILPNHPDLNSKLYFNGSTPYGYDFVSNTTIANDGGGRDSDPSDPGDWVTSTDAASGTLQGCTVTNSSWHGSMVAGIIGAASNNSQGVAGVSWGAKILPVRVLGKCGGYESDIIAGMLWAAGLSVSGVSDNIYPAKIINMSLGASGSCDAAYQDAVSQVLAAGSLIVAAAGNDAAGVGAPANCTGVLAVAALRNAGDKVGYSDYGTEVGIAAPGGNCGTSGTCQYPFYSTRDTGLTTPSSGSYSYSTASDSEVGTSFASPLVAGVAALMRSVNSSLTPTLLVSRLKSSATAFPTVSGVSSCASVTSGSGVECNCTTSTCGAGMLNAANAVTEALRPIAAISSSATTATAGGSITLNSTGSVAADGRTIASYLWTTSSGTLANADQASATLTASSSGTATVTLTVTDDAGKTDAASATITVTATVPGAPAIGTATAGNAQATVTFSAPASNGGAAITGYTATSSGGQTGTGTSSPITVTGLTNGTSYTFTVKATNSVGTGAASAASNSVTPKGSQTITFANPGSQVFGTTPTLTATATSGLTPTFSSSTTGVCTITSGGVVTFVTTGSCTINADQAGNTIYAAAPTVTQTFTVGIVVPGAPTIGTATAGDGLASVTFTAPASNGGTAITGYTVTSSGGQTGTGTSSPIIVTGLTNGTSYTFTVKATNSVGTGAASAASNSVTPMDFTLTVSTLPADAVTTTSTLNVSGTVTSPATLSALTVNGTAVTVNSDGSFSYPVQLVAGTNTITVVATDAIGSVTDTRAITLDGTAPSLTITSPPDNAATSQQNLTVTGTVGDRSDTVTYTINGGTPQNASQTDTAYSFTATLASGMNTILATAAANSGTTAQVKRSVDYQAGFSLSVTDPATDIRTTQGSYLLKGAVADNGTSVTVAITMDGTTYTPTVNATTGAFQQQLTLGSDKVYRVAVTGTDQGGTSRSVQRNIIHGAASSSYTIADALLALQATVGTVTLSASQIQHLDVAPLVNSVSVGDGKIDIEDVVVILRMAAGLL